MGPGADPRYGPGFADISMDNLARMSERRFTATVEELLDEQSYSAIEHIGWLGDVAILGRRSYGRSQQWLFVMDGDSSFAVHADWFNATLGTKGAPGLALADLADLVLQRLAASESAVPTRRSQR